MSKTIKVVEIHNPTNGAKEVTMSSPQSIKDYTIKLDKDKINPKSTEIFSIIIDRKSKPKGKTKPIKVEESLTISCNGKSVVYKLDTEI